MNVYAFGVQLGVGKVGAGSVRNPSYTPELSSLAGMLTPAQRAELEGRGCSPLEKKCRTGSRFGLQLSLPVQIGGSGVAFKLEPTFTFADSAKAIGLYLGPVFTFHVHQGLYLGFGLGLKAAYVKADAWRYAGDLYGRVPLTATYYLLDDLALVAEFGFGGGVSAYYSDRVVRNPLTNQRVAMKAPDATFGFSGAWDLTFGVRFP